MTRKIELSVNDRPIEIDYFVQSFIDHVVRGIIESLESTKEAKTIDLSIRDEEAYIELNGESVDMNAFVIRLVRSTITGMVTALKGVDEIDTLRISIAHGS